MAIEVRTGQQSVSTNGGVEAHLAADALNGPGQLFPAAFRSSAQLRRDG